VAVVRGLAYPLQLGADGRLVLAEDLSTVEQNIISVLETRPFERVMRADYGFDPRIFDVMEPTAINARIWLAVTTYCPAVEDLTVEGGIALADSGVYNCRLTYVVNGVAAPPLNLSLNI
jgi:hypothetical protein